MTRYTVLYAMKEYRMIDVEADSAEEAAARVNSEEALYSTNPLFATDRWLETQFGQVIGVEESGANKQRV